MDSTIRERMHRYRSTGGAANLARVEVLVPEADRADVLRYAASLRERYRARLSRESSLQALYEQAFKDYGVRCLWNARPPLSPDGLRVIVGRLRKHGDMAAWRLANRIEGAIRDAAG